MNPELDYPGPASTLIETVTTAPSGGDSDWQMFYMRLYFAVFVVIANMVVLNIRWRGRCWIR